jgi:YVTN family beta-propeller protein
MPRNMIILILALLAFTSFSPTDILAVATSGTSPTGDSPPEPILVERGQTFADVLPLPRNSRDVENIDPGPAPEGDYMGRAVFTPDGERVLLTNRMTDSVTIYDWATMAVLANVDLGDYPCGIAATDDYAVIACAFGDVIQVLNLSDYSVTATFPSAEQPWVVRISPDGLRAYVACDIPDVCEVIDLETMSHVMTISGFPIWLRSFSWGSENGRNSVDFSAFEVSPDGTELLVCDGIDSLLLFDTSSGLINNSIGGLADCSAVDLSGDGLDAVVICASNPVSAHRIDLTSATVTGSVSIPGYTLSTNKVGVNGDGSKAFLGVSNNSSAFIRFETADYHVLTSTYTPFTLGVSPDHTLAIGIQYRFSILDFATETLLGQIEGTSFSAGAVSLSGHRVVAFDPIRDEALHFREYEVPNAPVHRGDMPAGLSPEGDAPRRVAITPDGSKAVVTNVLSHNASIVNLDTRALEAVLPIGNRVQNVAITSDSRWAVICGFNSNSAVIVDLDDNTIVADVYCGSRAGVVDLSPDDSRAYIGNISSNSVSVLELDGAATHKIADIPCGVIGVSWAAYGVSSDVTCSPTGDYVLVAASFDDQVKVIDTASNSIVASIVVGDFPLQIAFNGSGDYATVTNYMGNTVSIIHVDGPSSSLVGTWNRGQKPLRLAYDTDDDAMGIGHYDSNTLVSIDPATGGYLGSRYYAGFGSLLQVGFDEAGEPLALTAATGDDPASFHRGDEVFPLPAAPSFFDYCPVRQRAAVVMPGPDHLTLLEWTMTGAVDYHEINLAAPGVLHPVNPNPIRGGTDLRFGLRQADNLELTIYDVRGRRVAVLASGPQNEGEHAIHWDGRDDNGHPVPGGVYFVEMRLPNFKQTGKLVYLR